MQPLVTVSGLAFEFPNGRQVFSNISFSLDQKITGLVGPNGVGKTTLAQLLAAQLEPTSGHVQRHAPVTFFPQRCDPQPLSVEDYLSPTYTWSALGEELLEGIDRQSLCTRLSGGQWMRVRLACTLDDQYLILDEPTNDLDHQGRLVLLEFLRRRKGGVLLISHDRECLGLCAHILELSPQGLTSFGGDWEFYLEQKINERAGLAHALEKAKRDRDAAVVSRNELRARQEKRNRQGQKQAARGGMPKILIGARKNKARATTGKIDAQTLERKAESIREAHQALSALKVDPIMYAELFGSTLPEQKLVAEAVGYNIRYNNWIYETDLNFVWRGNIRISLKGKNGSGKSTLLKAILGQKFETRGQLKTAELTTLYIDQRCESLVDELSIFENVRATASLSESEIRSGLAKFLFTKESIFQKAKDLSGGERLRASLACGFLSQAKPELLILDEPTNNLDLANVEFLEALIREFPAALIVISHDPVFLMNCGIQDEFVLD